MNSDAERFLTLLRADEAVAQEAAAAQVDALLAVARRHGYEVTAAELETAISSATEFAPLPDSLLDFAVGGADGGGYLNLSIG